jgi:hypothetical protein
MMLPRAWAGLLAVIGTALTTAAAPTSGSDTEALLYTIYAGPVLELRAISPSGTGARSVAKLANVPGIYRVALSPDATILGAEGDGRRDKGRARRLACSAAAVARLPAVELQPAEGRLGALVHASVSSVTPRV